MDKHVLGIGVSDTLGKLRVVLVRSSWSVAFYRVWSGPMKGRKLLILKKFYPVQKISEERYKKMFDGYEDL